MDWLQPVKRHEEENHPDDFKYRLRDIRRHVRLHDDEA